MRMLGTTNFTYGHDISITLMAIDQRRPGSVSPPPSVSPAADYVQSGICVGR